jgi:hypothetical protein
MQAMANHVFEFNAKSYPITVVRGCAAIDEIVEFNNMPDGFIRVIMKLIKKIDVMHPEKPIFARRKTLALESGKSDVTVNRALKWLEDNGMITRSQKCKSNMKGSDSPIAPTGKLINLLGFGEQKKKKVPAVKNDCSVSEIQIPNINTQSDKKSANKPDKTIINGVAMPNDLVWLVTERRMNPYGVLKLMKLATDSGKLLSDIVQATRKWLEQGKFGNALYAYLRALIGQNKDYKAICSQQKQAVETQVQSVANAQLIERKAFEWQGKTFQSTTNNKQYSLDKGYINELDNRKIIGSRMLDIRFIEAVQESRLRIVG